VVLLLLVLLAESVEEKVEDALGVPVPVVEVVAGTDSVAEVVVVWEEEVPVVVVWEVCCRVGSGVGAALEEVGGVALVI
jgi:hypothetical protein